MFTYLILLPIYGNVNLNLGSSGPEFGLLDVKDKEKNRRPITLPVLKRARFCSLMMNIRNGRDGDVETARERRA